MSISLISTIKERVKSAKETSKIAVFIVVRGSTIDFNAVFDSTVATKRRIKDGCIYYVGSYHGDSGIDSMLVDMNNAKY